MGGEKLRVDARRLIENDNNDVFASAASTWEIAIKAASGKLDAPEQLEDAILRTRFVPLPISIKHTQQAAWLPSHHGDPFDRMLVAQAQIERCHLVTRDRHLSVYDVTTIRA